MKCEDEEFAVFGECEKEYDRQFSCMSFIELLQQGEAIGRRISSCQIPCNVESIELLDNPLRVVVKVKGE